MEFNQARPVSARPVTSLRHQGGEEFSERGPNFLNYVHDTVNEKPVFFHGGLVDF